MSSARTEILARIRRAHQQALLPDATGITPEPPQPSPFAQPLPQVFAQALIAVQGKPHHCRTTDDVADLVAEICRKQEQTQVLGWQPAALPLPDLPAALAARSIELLESQLGQQRRQQLDALNPVLVGLTGAAAGLARTGSLVLLADSQHGRLASLMPDIHIALLRQSDIYADIAAWMAAPGTSEAIASHSNTVVITGPSRTADIAQTLTLGAHGPRELHVILLDSP